MRSCPSCGTSVPGDTKFCPACGGSMSLTCPACASAVEELWHFCPVCSGPLSRQCTACGALVSVSASFCNACGWPLDAAPRQQPARATMTIVFAVAQGRAEPDRASLNDRLSALSEVARGWGGRAQRMPGNRLRVLFGLPEAGDGAARGSASDETSGEGAAAPTDPAAGDSVGRAIRAAIDLVSAGAGDGSLPDAIGVRVGVATGDVVLPDFGAEDPIVAGPVVNVAATLADASKPGRVLVEEGTYLAAGGRFRFGRPRLMDGDERTGGEVLARRLLLEGEDDADDVVPPPPVAGPSEAAPAANGAEEAPAPEGIEMVVAPSGAPPAESPVDRARALERSGDEQAADGNGEDAARLYLEALSLARVEPALTGERARLCVKALKLATGEAGASGAALRDPAAMEDLVAEGLASAADEETHAWLLALKGACAEQWSGRAEDPVSLAERIDVAEAARSIAETLRAPELRAFVGRTLDWLYWAAGDYAAAVQNARWMLSVADQVDDAAERAEIIVRSAFTIMCVQGRYAEVSELARRAAALARLGGPHARMHATFLTISAAYHRGRWSELLPELQEHLDALLEDPDSHCPFVRGGTALGALALAQMGDRERAAEVASRVPIDDASPGMVDGLLARYAVAFGDARSAKELAGRVLATADEPEAAVAMIEALASLQEWEALLSFVAEAREMAGGMAFLEPVCDRAEGLAEAATGNRWRALESLRGALGAFESLSVPFEAARTREFIAVIALPEEARDLLEHAAATYERLGATAYAERARRALRDIAPASDAGDWPQASGSAAGF